MAAYPELDAIVAEFLASVDLRVQRACFDVAGPVKAGRAKLTNLPGGRCANRPWPTRSGCARSGCSTTWRRSPWGSPGCPRATCGSPHRRKPAPTSAIAVLAPGTGPGEAFLVWTGERSSANPSKGDHGDLHPGPPRAGVAGLSAPALRPRKLGARLLGDGASPTSTTSSPTSGRPSARGVAKRIAVAPDRTRAIIEAALDPGIGLGAQYRGPATVRRHPRRRAGTWP
jgi:glucokinase